MRYISYVRYFSTSIVNMLSAVCCNYLQYFIGASFDFYFFFLQCTFFIL